MGARRIPRRFGNWPQVLLNSVPCNILVIPALVKYVRLIAVLKTQPFDFFKIQDLRVFDLDT